MAPTWGSIGHHRMHTDATGGHHRMHARDTDGHPRTLTRLTRGRTQTGTEDRADCSVGSLGNITPLTLQQRVDILIGVARALDYLHSFGIVHRDIKPANILLDSNMQAKLANFGLLRVGEGSRSLQSTRVMGTPGYVDPVYSITHKATISADVYSFGVVMMELLTCKRVVLPCEDGSHIHIKDWVEQQVEGGDSASVVNVDFNAPHAVASKLVDTSLSCVAKLVSNRPTMSQVLVELEALRRELMGGREERVARQLDAAVQRASLDCSQLEEELAVIYGAQNK
ncbi:unnamed protein product [Closterium sp. Yama58-4]|nr:unnamed protein product [Closterium sp. Yama58-4]